MIKKEIIVEKDKKLIDLLQDYGFSYADANKILRRKDIKLNGKVVKQNQTVFLGDKITVFYANDMFEKKYKIVFEDDQVLIIFKNVGIETEGERGLESVLQAYAVHRLDRNTEGLMVFAKTLQAKNKLDEAFKQKTVHKFYLAEVVGKFDTIEKTYVAYLIKNKENASVKIYQNHIAGSVKIETVIKTIKSNNESSLLQIELKTGKTHQIRAHLAFLGHPIIGDGKYGINQINKKFKKSIQKLSCFKLKFDFVGIESINFKEFNEKPRWL